MKSRPGIKLWIFFGLAFFTVVYYVYVRPDWLHSSKISILQGGEERRMAEKLDRISSYCHKYYGDATRNASAEDHQFVRFPKYAPFYFDEERSLVYCATYKVATTSMLQWLLHTKGLTDDDISRSGKMHYELARIYFPLMNSSQAEPLLKEARTKFMVVRHPFDRLLSAYRDKLANTSYNIEHGTLVFHDQYGRHIVEKYRPKDSNLTQVECTFEEFIHYIIDLDLNVDADLHWSPYYLFCQPCLVQYDAIIHLETIERDFPFVLDRLGRSDRPEWLHATTGGITKPAILQRYFSTIKRSALIKLYEKLRPDFDMFGYSPEAHLNMTRDG